MAQEKRVRVRKADKGPLVVKEIKTLRDLTPDDINANKGTVRGLAMLEDSVREHGIGDGITVGADGGIIGGNKRTETMVDVGFGDVEPIVVQTDGTRPVVIQRTDLDSKSPKARALGVALNRTAQVSIAWDAENLQRIDAAGVNLAPYFDPPELDAINAAQAAAAEAAANLANVGQTPTAVNSATGGGASTDPAAFQQLNTGNTTTEHTCPKCGYAY
jgi:hypothetical protein